MVEGSVMKLEGSVTGGGRGINDWEGKKGIIDVARGIIHGARDQ